MNQRIIRLPQVQEMVGLGKTVIYGKIKDDAFPRQVKMGRISGWVESEIQEWIVKQMQSRGPTARERQSTSI